MNPCQCCCTVGHITACDSRLDTDMLLVHRRLGPKSDIEKTARIIHSAQRTFTRFAWFPILANSTIVSLFAKRFPAGRWSFLGPGSETKWYSTYKERPRGECDRDAESMMIKFGESGHPVFRATSPLSRGTLKCKGGGKLSIHFCAHGDTIETVFRTIISVNQLNIYGAVSDLCEEYSNCRTRTGRPVVAEQSDPHFAPADLLITTPRPSNEIPAQEHLVQKYRERAKIWRTNRKVITTRQYHNKTD